MAKTYMTGYSDNKDYKYITWRECPFRSLRAPDAPIDLACDAEEVVCEAGGGIILGRSNTGGADAICGSCDIPRSLNKRYACLFLAPFRVFQRESVRSYYSCRWSLDIPARNVPKNNDWCKGCVHWFPWPPDFLIPNLLAYSHKALELFLKDIRKESSHP